MDADLNKSEKNIYTTITWLIQAILVAAAIVFALQKNGIVHF
jgi:hypothetical protein